MATTASRVLIWAVGSGLALSLGACCPSASAPSCSLQPGETIYFVPNTNHMLALTFDDGPNGAATEKILDILNQFHVPATFFLVGINVTYYPDIAQRIAREGHEIGNHTFAHRRFDQSSAREMTEDITTGAEAITSATGVKPVWFRPPYGINGAGLEAICTVQGLTLAGWSGHASDWNPRSAVEIAEHMITQATPGDILLLHDGWETRHDVDRQSTVDGVYLILERLTREGFQFVTLSELVRHAGPPLARFANGVCLLGLHVQAKPIRPGDGIDIRYFWDVPREWNPKASMAFMHFEGPGGFRFQDDHRLPIRGDVRDLALEHVLVIPSNAVIGRYQGRLGLMDPARPDVRHRVPVHSWRPYRKDAVMLPDILEIRTGTQ